MWGRRVRPATLPAPFSATLSLALSVYLRECGATGSASGQTACPVRPTLHQTRSHHGHASPLHPGARLRLSYRSGGMFLFYLLGVRLPCCSIFCQFWLCEEAQCVYLSRHLGSPCPCVLYNCFCNPSSFPPIMPSPLPLVTGSLFSISMSLTKHCLVACFAV